MLTHSPSIYLKNILREKIANSPQQKITFCEYMNLVLYHPEYGYYNRKNLKIGKEGDFFTSSSLGADFGELLAEQFLQMWHILGKPCPFTLAEIGAGEGLLAKDILVYLEQNYPDFLAALKYIIIEQSDSLIKQQKTLLKKWQPPKVNVEWKTWEEIKNNSVIGCCFSNELIDAFPVHKIIKIDGVLKEVYVTIDNDLLEECLEEISTNQIQDYFELVGINLLDSQYFNGYQTEVNIAALNWIEKISEKLKQGYLLTIDYGYPSRKYYHPQRSKGTLNCYYQHRHHHNPYVNLGSQDITTHIDFTALERKGKLCGLETLGFTPQAMFLMALGLGDRLLSLSSDRMYLADILQRRDYLHQLINPTGLGGFGVLIQGKGLKEKQKQIKLRGLTTPE
jgi:SAM-dependent MidA family methyltransferase